MRPASGAPGAHKGMAVEQMDQARRRLREGNAAGAHTALVQALDVSRQAGDRAGMAEALHEMAHQARLAGDLGAADKLLRQAIELRLSLGDRGGWVASVFELGLLEKARGETALAMDMLSRALFTARQLGAPGDIGGCLHEMGVLRLGAGDLDSAVTLFTEALEQRRLAGDIPGQAATTHQIGVVSETRGDMLAALDHYQQSLDFCAQMGDDVGRVANLLRLAAVYQQRRRFPDAERVLGSAVDVARARGRADLLATALRRLGGVRYARGAAADAFTALWQAHTLAPDPEMAVWMRGLRVGMGPEVFAALAAQLGVPPDVVREFSAEPAAEPQGDPPLTLAELVAVRLRVGPAEFERLAERGALAPELRARVDKAARGLES